MEQRQIREELFYKQGYLKAFLIFDFLVFTTPLHKTHLGPAAQKEGGFSFNTSPFAMFFLSSVLKDFSHTHT